jgi:hypothetical protein
MKSPSRFVALTVASLAVVIAVGVVSTMAQSDESELSVEAWPDR